MLGVRAGERCDVLWNEGAPSIPVPRTDRTTSHVLLFYNKVLVVLPGSRSAQFGKTRMQIEQRLESNAKARSSLMNLISSTSADNHVNEADFEL
jgi:hypothetical protein